MIKKKKMSKNLHLTKTGYYNKLLFYQFLIQLQVIDPHNCIHWAMISAAATYERGANNNSGFTTSSCYLHKVQRLKHF